MTDLERARTEISEADRQIAALFEKRMNAVRAVAAYKKKNGIPILDERQEEKVIERNSAYIRDPELLPYYVDFLKDSMAISRTFQHHLVEDARIAYSGVEGAFAHIAARKIFPDGVQVSYESFNAAYEAVLSNECDYAVLPIENSYAGEVGQVLDLMFAGELYVNGVFDLHISQNLLGIPGASVSDIRTVISHPQALGQCANYIHDHGMETLQASNTARAAQYVAEQNDPSVAAIASRETADLYGLTLLERDINESNDNCTRFAVFSRSKNHNASTAGENAFILLFTVNDVAGALAKAVSIIGEYGFNMQVLRSRPVKVTPWQYYFYVEAIGDDTAPAGREMLAKLSEMCTTCKIVGRYQTKISLKDNETL